MIFMGFKLVSNGNWTRTLNFLSKSKELSSEAKLVLDSCGRKGVRALQKATPVDSGETARAWGYNISTDGDTITLQWTNDHLENGRFPVAIMLQYGHGTGTGGYVTGVDYINPALKPVFDEIVDTIWRAVTTS